MLRKRCSDPDVKKVCSIISLGIRPASEVTLLGYDPLAFRGHRKGRIASDQSPVPRRGENFQPPGNLFYGSHEDERNLGGQAWQGS